MVSWAILFTFLLSGSALAAADTGANSSAESKRQDDPTQPVGINPISTFKTLYIGRQNAINSCSHRDLGFTGSLQGKWYAVYGDTLWCSPGVTDPEKDPGGFHGMVRDSVSLMTDNPLVVEDLHLNNDFPGHQLQFIPFNEAWHETNLYGFGGTSIVETVNGDGIVFFLVNANEAGLQGAGIAKVELVNGEPTVTQRFGEYGYWWLANTTPRYGDVAAFRDPHSDYRYIYAWGGAPTSVLDYVSARYVYLLRVQAASTEDLGSYEYWWGEEAGGWKKGQPLTEFKAQTAVMWNTGQGQIVWNDYYRCYIFVHLEPGTGDVVLRTATALEGPWTPDVKVYTATPIDGGLTYAGVAHPYLDSSGRTLTISYTNNNRIEVIRVTFSI
ncbi:hypothetical protein F5Y04DRAFT_210211 [Hypomontagnella monticulosa]|nr:hypothetical protein F5Y04DRAFT_210211 [Hypomontagnella monticulosa]